MRLKFWMAFLAFIILLAAITNPEPSKHREVLTTELKRIINKDTPSDADDWRSEAAKGLGMLLGSALIEGIVARTVSTENYVVCSISKIQYDGEQHLIAIGAFGNVFILYDLEDLIDKRLLKA
jgi:hypothetical protein